MKQTGIKEKSEKNFNGEIYHYTGFHGFPAFCGLNVYMREDRAIVIFTELPDNPGTSITNMIEHLATKIYQERFKGCPIESIRFVENYPPDAGASLDCLKEGTLDLVEFDWNGREFKSPRWTRLFPKKKTGKPFIFEDSDSFLQEIVATR